METPTPVNLNALTSILAKSKQVMKKVDAEKPIVSKGGETRGLSETVATSAKVMPNYSESDEREPIYEEYAPSTSQSNIHEVVDYTAEHVHKSKLPAVVKEAMLKNHIPKAKFTTSKFSLEDVSELIEKKPMANPQQAQKRQLNETTHSSNDMITISRSELQNMINEAVMKFFKTSYDKSITEDTIKKTLNILIKEGRVVPKKK